VIKPLLRIKKPVIVELTEGETYYYCTCGRSAGQPLCDGSHSSTSFRPEAFCAKKSGKSALCACKKTENAPYCDGSHSKL